MVWTHVLKCGSAAGAAHFVPVLGEGAEWPSKNQVKEISSHLGSCLQLFLQEQ